MTVSESLRRTGQAEPGSNQAANALHQATATPPLPGDMDTLRELFDPEIVWHFPGRSPLAGDHRGTDVVLGFFGRTGPLRAELSQGQSNGVMPILRLRSSSA
jgi:ketosteroid isomerase-like protein